MLYISFQNMSQSLPSLVRCAEDNSYLTPHEHASKHHLQPVKKVLPDDYDHSPAGGPALAGTDGFDAGRGCFGNTQRHHPVRDTQPPGYG